MRDQSQRIRLAFIIRSLEVGGAERQLCALAKGLDKSKYDVSVLTMYGGGTLEADLDGVPGVRLVSLEKRGRWEVARFGGRLLGELRRLQPHIVHGYMSGANELALVFGKAVGARVVWGIRVSNLSPSDYVWSVGAVFRAEALLSRWVDLIIANSEAGRAFHAKRGFAVNRMAVIPNGIDTARFHHNLEAGRAWRASNGVPPDALIIGLPARFDPMKDHSAFLKAVAQFLEYDIPVRFVCAGNGPEEYRAGIRSQASQLGLEGRISWIPAMADPVPFYNAVDLVTISSKGGEGFPNVLGEAMACEVPCVATDVGDSALIVGDTGHIVGPGDHAAMARRWREICLLDTVARQELGSRARQRVRELFTPALLVERTAAALEMLL